MDSEKESDDNLRENVISWRKARVSSGVGCREIEHWRRRRSVSLNAMVPIFFVGVLVILLLDIFFFWVDIFYIFVREWQGTASWDNCKCISQAAPPSKMNGIWSEKFEILCGERKRERDEETSKRRLLRKVSRNRPLSTILLFLIF